MSYLQKCHCYISSSARRSTRRRSRRRSSSSVSTRCADEPRRRAHTPVLIRVESCPFSPSPSFHALTPSRARAQCHRRRPRRPSSPPPLDSPRPKPRDLAPKLLHPSTDSAATTPGRNRSCRPNFVRFLKSRSSVQKYLCM